MTRALVIGVGGLGSAATLTLARARPLALTLLDDDVVEQSNLHRQLLYNEADVGTPKLEAAARRLAQVAADAAIELQIDTIDGRFVPDNALALAREHDLIIEGADHLSTKFLAADAARLAGVPIVQAGAVRWNGWAMAATLDSACVRCVFEDLPRERVETCAEAGVVGPVVGVMGGLQAHLTLAVLAGGSGGTLIHYDALRGRLASTRIDRRESCPLCAGEIRSLSAERYQPACAA